MLNARSMRTAATLAVLTAFTAACGNLDANSSRCTPSGKASTLTIGYVSPQTGSLAGFGEADQFVVGQMNEHFAKNPLTVGGKTYSVKIVRTS